MSAAPGSDGPPATGALHALRARDLAAGVRRGDLGPVEITRAHLDRASGPGRALGALVYLDAEGALAQAAMLERRRAAGEALGPLAGVPVALKDNLCVRGVPTTCASRILADWVPPYDAHVVERLRSADAILIGKTNMDELGMGSSSERSCHGPVRSPWDLARTAGGSSGGSAAAVCAGLAPVALGTDTGGSVRQPASMTGVVGLKPTYGRVSRHGVVAFASSLDQVGVLARDAADAALLLGVIAGADPRDPTCAPGAAPDYVAQASASARGVRVGVLRDLPTDGAQPEVRHAAERAARALADEGCELVEVALPHLRHAVAAYYLIATAEASSNLARFDGMRFGMRVESGDLRATYGATRAQGFGEEVRRRLLLGTFALSAGYYDAYYARAQKVRTLVRRDFARAFAEVDVLLTPTAPTTAFPLGERTGDPLSMYLSDVFTVPASLAGLPALSVPAGSDASGLPIGVQLVGPAYQEGRLLALAARVERALGGFVAPRGWS